jgi:lipid-binding SYLF domain-containing protein
MTGRRWAAGLALAAGIALLPAVVQSQDAKQRTKCEEATQLFRATDRDMAKFFDDAVGYAIFPSVGKGAFIVGGAAGTGCLYESGALVGQAKLVQVTVGLQLGGQSYAEIIFFQTHDAIESFKSSNFEMSAQLSAVAAASGASANAKYELGVLVFTIAKGGLMYEASVGGQKFTFKPLKEPSSGDAPEQEKD